MNRVLTKELLEDCRALVRPLTDEQVTRAGERPQRRVEQAGVLETVFERRQPVPCAPDDERPAANVR